MAGYPARRHTRYGERRARLANGTPEDRHCAGEHDEHQTADCRLCVEQSIPYSRRQYGGAAAVMATTSYADSLREQIRHATWDLEVSIPGELAATNHARRRASLHRSRREVEQRLSWLTTELSAAVQDPDYDPREGGQQ